ncbi:dipeptide ABC transporter ATP-binding protein [Bilophila wadsworthia]|uniref:dipeptide ABC transporter ATP-binding protein n=1 Tax=Bilophila wadsworthia TaxID=35833 RepID=UPI00266D5D41|nr:dipeptide ABC transporter ATP-binding protein [Bilophila wadsworthia]
MGPSDRNVLEVQGLTVRFDTSERSVVAVKDLGFHVRAGEVLAIVGESGSGKSVTSLSVMRLIEHGGGTIASGKISFTRRNGGKLDLAKAADSVMRTIRGGEISMIFQEPMTSLNPVFSVGTQVAEAVMLHQGLSHAEAEAEALRMLELVRIPEAKQILKRYPHQLSGGMRQRVMIAMALSCKPSLLIADEPTTALDVTIQAQILQLIRQLQEEMGMAVIFITHDMGVVAEVADRVLVMYHGEAVEEGTCEQIFHNPRHPYTQSLLAAVPRLGSMRGTDEPAPFPLLRITDPEAEQLGTADMDETPVDMPEPAASAPSVSDGPVLSVDNLITRFDVETGFWGKVKRRVHAVEQVSFNLYPGETLGLVGESGCGKSTIGRSLIGLETPRSGSIVFNGQELTQVSGSQLQKLRRNIQYVFQDPYAALDPRLTVGFSIMEPLLIHKVCSRQEAERRVGELLERVDLDPAMAVRYPHEFSGGQRQRVCIARALAMNPEIIIADESVSALDVSVRAQIINLLLALQKEFRIAFSLISPALAVIERVCHRVAVMYLGQIVELGSRRDVFEKPLHPYTKRLMSAVPIPDPSRRTMSHTLLTGEIPSPVRSADYEPVVAPLKEVSPGHFVSEEQVANWF